MSSDPEDERIKFLYRQVSQAFRHIPIEKLSEAWSSDLSRRSINEFLDHADSQSLFLKESKSGVEISEFPPKDLMKSKGTLFYFVKLKAGTLSASRMAQDIIYGDIPGDPLEHLATLAQKIYHPMISSKATAQAWTETIAKEVRDNFEAFVGNVQITQGHVKGITCLPLPSTTSNGEESSSAHDGYHSQIHALEGAIITWTKQIKNVLKQDPESAFVNNANPGPMAEIEFWKSKATNLNGIFEQLQSDRVRRVLKILDKSKSTYNGPFARLCKEVFHARAEANNITRHLKPLILWLNGLEGEVDFEHLSQHFRPIMHIVLLVWKNSAYYNTPARLVIMLRENCNTLIQKAGTYLNGDALFDLIDQQETHSAIKMLQTCIRVLGRFKNSFLDYKAKASVECADNPWRVQNNAVFVRLDSFLERCHDILDLAQTILLFSKLAKIEVGGTKGKTLTTSIAQIYFDFSQAVDNVRAVGAGILDLNNKAFEDAFYEFRTRMKELDRRLGSVVVQGFDDATSVASRFRLLDTFDTLINRPIIANELEKKHATLIEAVRQDVEEVTKIFMTNREVPPVASNLPPIAGALTWCRGLLERVQGPLEKLKLLDKKILEREDTRDVIKMYTALVGQLADYDREKIETWGRSIEASSQAKLKNPLLRRGDSDDALLLATVSVAVVPLAQQLLHVNFDPILVKLLREVKYFLLLGLQVPPSAMEIYQRAEIFRRHTGNLDLIVNMYNDIQTTLLPVERPLVRTQLERIDKTLSQGIGEGKNKAKALNWKSNTIETFIAESMTEVKLVSEMLQMLKGNLKHIETTVAQWQTQPVFERGNRSLNANDFLALQKKARHTKLAVVKEAGQEIHRLLKDTNKKLKVSQGLPDWKAYIDFVNNVVVSGLTDAVEASLKSLASQLNPKFLEANGLPPLLDIQVDLIDQKVVFIPEIAFFVEGEKEKVGGVKNIIYAQVNGIFGLASAFKRLDTSEGTYLQEIREIPSVLVQSAKIAKFMDSTEESCNKLRTYFRKFEYLWQHDLNQIFAQFLVTAVTVECIPFSQSVEGAPADGAAAVGPPPTPGSNGAPGPASASQTSGNLDPRTHWAKTTINLDLFGEKIKTFIEIQTEVSDMRAVYEVDFLKVNAQPVKQAISTLVTKWLYVHTQYLQSYVGDQLTELYTFLRDVNKGLDTMLDVTDKEGLMSIMTNIRDVRKRMPQISSMFEPLRSIVMLLKARAIAIDLPPIGGYAALDFLEKAKMMWENTVNKTYKVKENIQPLQNNMLASIFKDIKNANQADAKFIREFKKNGPFSLEPDHREAYASLDRYQRDLDKLLEQGKMLNEQEDLFELQLSTHSSLLEVRDNLRTLKGVWDIVCLVEYQFAMWRNTLWADIRTDELLEEVRRLQMQLKNQSKKPREWPVFKMLELNVKNMATALPLVHELRSPAMRERHWRSLMVLTGSNFDRGPTFCLDDLLSSHLHRHVAAISEIVEVANKELKIENRLNMIEEVWKKFTLKFDRHRDTEVFIVSTPDDVLEALEEHHLHLQSMAGMGKFVDFFRDQVVRWQGILGEVETTLKLLLTVERQWGSLESIFLGSADIRAQLPDDTKRFEAVDNELKETMREIQTKPGVIACCTAEGREQTLRNMHKELEKCEKALNEYLEVKKNVFPRFYFVSNAALLDILSNGNNPTKIIPHVGSLFDGIGQLKLCLSVGQAKLVKEDPESNPGPPEAASAMVAKDKEEVVFPAIFEMRGAVENWLNDLVRFMQFTLRGVLSTSMADAAQWEMVKTREEWVLTVPAQIAFLTAQIVWTEETEEALEEVEGGTEDALKKYNDMCTSRLEGLIRIVQGELKKDERVKVITLITSDVHNRDVISALVKKRVESNLDFKWQSQLRYYWVPTSDISPDANVNIRICDFATSYSFEYIGNCGRLVITPLTDRCYVTLTVALRLMLGGAPAGPAGTGKTETTKDLARGLGLPCYVFNCSDQMNYQTIGDIFKGLTQCGAWGCFDEFNRIEIEVLSVVASQVRCILDAIMLLSVKENRPKEYQTLPAGTPATKVGTFVFFGEEISLVPTVGLFITMNPGYAGRTELPENLKALFRSCAMIQPDLLPIAENMLMAEGFVKARPLSVKFVTLYKLSSELLSKQHHYDWGLRAIKSVLRVAGVLKRADPEYAEEAVLMRALRDFNTPKIPSNDVPIFLRLISDLFPGMELPPKVDTKLHKLCVDVCKGSGLISEEMFVQKVLQFQEILDVRHSVMLLGPAGCGKSSVWKTLAACHNFGRPKPITLYETVNPKAVTTDELYGYMTLTKDWKDGVLSIIMRNMSKNISPYHHGQTGKWVVLDGDIDAVWIESMNTVMDDNKVLTLVSNERIPLTDAMRMVFEVHTLKNATPATVSRAGILYINETDVGYQPYVDSWLAARPTDAEKHFLPDLFDRYLSKIVDYYTGSKSETIVPLPIINLVQTNCLILEGLIKTQPGEKTQQVLERLFIYASMWAFGGALSSDKLTDYRKTFSVFFRGYARAVKFPDQGNVMDFFIDPTTGEAIPWQSKVSQFTSNAQDSPGGNIVVPTVETVRLTYLLDSLVRNERPVMLVGSSGTGKTVLVNDYLSSLVTEDNYRFVTINMNYYTDALALQNQLEQHIDKRSGKTFGPPSGKLIYFVDDMNLPFVEEYGTQTPIALLNQYIDHGGWYDRSDVSLKKSILDCQYVSCMNHKSGCFFISPRLQRHFATFACLAPGETDLQTIFGTILTAHLANFRPKVSGMSKNLTDATITLHKEMLIRFLPSATKFHYNFTMRDLAAVFRGLLFCRPNVYTVSSQMTRLWYHETMRVYSDRLVTELEIQRCREMVVNVGKRFMDDDADGCYADPCTFTHFANAGDDHLSTYVPCEDTAKLKSELEKKLAEYNESYAIMKLVLFEQAMRHVTRIARILMFPGGNALLVGVGGSGKQSLSKLAAFICQYETVQISVTSEYSIADLKESLKEMYRKAAVKPGLPLVFMLADTQITDERFLVYINDLLSSGRIPDLFTKEEYDGIFSSLRSIAKSEGVPDSRDSMMNFFINRVKNHLHVVLCFSPVGDLFRQRARRFPGIVNCTTIDWFHEWPKDALVSVAQRFLDNVETGGPPEVRDNIAYHIAEVHASVAVASAEYLKEERRFNYTTPKSFLELIEFYKHLLKTRRDEMSQGIKRLDVGLDTLMRTNKDVERLQEFLKEKKKEVESKKAATDVLLEEMGKQRSEAEAQQALADVEKNKAERMSTHARRLEEQAAGDLAIAKPALDAATDAVNCLDKASMTELKAFAKLPPGVDKVTTALLIMIKGEKKDFSWENAKKMMAKLDAFKEKLELYRGEDIPEDVISRVSPMLEDPDFNFERMRTKSAAAANLVNWVVNIITFNGIYKRVKPLMDSLDVATKAKRRAEEDLAVVNDKLAVIEGKLSKLQSEFMAATQEKAKVEAEARECEDRLSLANRLTTGLASEKERWGQTVEALRLHEVTLAGDVMLAAAFTSYIGAFSASFRIKLWKEIWLVDLKNRDVPLTENIDPLWVLTTEPQAAVWQGEGLPSDRISIENGAIITNSSRWPLLVDPQLQGIRWLKKNSEVRCKAMSKRVHLIRYGDPTMMSKMLWAIQAGDTMILENIGETVDASLDPILSKSVYRKGKGLFIKMGDEDVGYDENFRFFLQTKLSNPHYRPEIAAQCTIVNFIVTKKGLEEQLLASIVSVEEPELEETRNRLVQSFNSYKIQLKDLEDQLLERLANAPPDILSDTPLIEGLEQTKETANEINEAVAKGIQTEIGINQAREVYRIVATEASLVYFAILQLSNVDHMYQYSLDSFQLFFVKALQSAKPAPDKPQRVKELQASLRSTIFRWVLRGLFERHRLTFLTMLVISLMQSGIVGDDCGYNGDMLRFLLLGPRNGDEKSPVSWLSDPTWNGIRNLSLLEGFEKLATDMEENASRFLEWFQSFSPETEKLPGDYRELEKAPFKKLLVVRILRPDRMTIAMTNFIRETLPNGKKFVECDNDLSSSQILEQSFEDSTPLIPMFFVLSPGSDVVSEVDKLAAKSGKVKGVSYFNISLGQGQDVVAAERMEVANRQGYWVFLNNVHLMPRWLTTLERKLDEYAWMGAHADFRIMLSSDPSPAIPVSILDRAIKITSDPPSGLKANLKQAFGCFSKDTYEELEPRTKGILFGLCQFHAVMVERKKFGPKGFNMMYPFSIGDLVCSAAVLKNYMESAPAKVPWADLRYLFGEIMYGGHIVNDFDRELATAYMDFYMKEDLLDEMGMFPYPDPSTVANIDILKAPSVTSNYERVLEHIDESIKGETPAAFGLHPNAEIGFRTQMSEALMRSVLELSAASSDGAGVDAESSQQIAESIIQDVQEQLRDAHFDIESISSVVEEVGPFQNVLLQECDRMNSLVSEMQRTLTELDLGFKGELTISEAMEDMATSLYLDRVPKQWEQLAYPSMRSLGAWLTDLQARVSQLNDWAGSPQDAPPVMWICGMFNPQSFLTAVMQVTAQAQGLELDRLTLVTEITRRVVVEEVSAASKDGTFIIGLFLEGAAWNLAACMIESSKPREMYVPLPIINMKPAIVDRFESGTFMCPVYKTQKRGPTYVFSLQLKTKLEPAKWVLAGVAAVMEVV